MKITKELLKLGIFNDTINKSQCDILDITYPTENNWQDKVIDKELATAKINLFIILCGKLPLTTQKQIIKNYKNLSNFHNKKEKPKEVKVFLNNLRIYCDGACQGNPGKSGSGLAIYSGDDKPILLYGDYKENGTNNTAELKALYKALLIAQKYNIKTTIFCDSKYSIDSISKWAYGWKKNNWRKKGGEIKNLDIIKLAHNLFDDIQDIVEIKHVKGHSGVEGNELADRMAIKAVEKSSIEYIEFDYTNVRDVL